MRSPGFALAFLTMPLVVRGDSEGTWCYDSQDPKCGEDRVSCPTHWKEMAPACGGPAQSPINIDLHLVQRDPTLGPFILQGYNTAPPGPWTLENDGHTDAGPQSHLEIRGAGLPLPAYRALQLHFHWGGPGRAGSEHSLDGQRRPMEMHVVHMNTRYQSMGEARGHPDGLAVLAVLLVPPPQEQDTDNANFSVLVSSLKNVSERGVSESGLHLPAGLAAAGRLRPLALLPLLGVANHAWLPAFGCLDCLRGRGTHRARTGGPIPDHAPGRAPRRLSPRTAHRELPPAAASRGSQGLGLSRCLHLRSSLGARPNPSPCARGSAGPVALAEPLGTRFDPFPQ
ncbi:carbonic anhydrase 15-like isoform X3 [Leopardus geoffroyi]|uniref:carbonic anhydrase 15-like isoform X3 n=1 Tax=Leopardus geoffroyi TaxID=46844 RepID=UPI001E25DF30|nr:carbonic anhydrase 15-like isoform X3 [Leopardus geoffroyi]